MTQAWRVLGCLALALSSGCIRPNRAAKDTRSGSDSESELAPQIEIEPYVWKNVEILGGGFVTGIVMSTLQKDLIYARTDIGGAYRFEPGTQSWVPITDGFGRDEANTLGIESLALDPTDPDKVYLAAGTYTQPWAGPGVMLRSNDRGATWEVTPMSHRMGANESGRSAGERLGVDPNLPTKLLFGSRLGGLLQSLDGSKTWSNVEGFPKIDDPDAVGVTLVAFDARSGRTGEPTPVIYAGVARGEHGLYETRNAGQTWAAVAGQPKGFIPSHLEMDGRGTVYVAYRNRPGPNDVTDGALYRYDPASGAWTDITPVRPSQNDPFGYGGISVDRSHPGTLVATTLDRWALKDEIFRTTDGGASWRAIGSNAEWDAAGARYLYWGKNQLTVPHWMGDIEIDPHDPDRAMFVTGAGIWMTDNLTRADENRKVPWRFFSRGLEEASVAVLVSPPAGPPLLSGVEDLCGFRHDRLDRSPSLGAFSSPSCIVTTGLDFAELKPALVVRVGRSWDKQPHGAASHDGGATWMAFPSEPKGAETGGLVAVTADGGSLVWSTKGQMPAVSNDLGRTWKPVRGVRQGIPLSDWANLDLLPVSDRVNPKRVYLYDAHLGGVFVSSDAGHSFSPGFASLPRLEEAQLGAASIQAVPRFEGHLWVTTGRALYHSSDGGTSFRTIDTVDESYGIGTGRPGPGRAYPSLFLAGLVHGVKAFFRSDDRGATWARINDDAHEFGWVSVIEGDPRVFGRVYLGTSGRGLIVGTPE